MPVSETITAILPAAGQGQRWNRAFGTVKQLIAVDGGASRPLLIRTIRMLRDRGIQSIHVLSNEPEIWKAVSGEADILHPSDERYLSDTLLSSRSIWADKTIILLGDVYFSSSCVDSIVQSCPEICFWGVGLGSTVCRNGLRCPELFAFSFLKSVWPEVEENLRMNCVELILSGALIINGRKICRDVLSRWTMSRRTSTVRMIISGCGCSGASLSRRTTIMNIIRRT